MRDPFKGWKSLVPEFEHGAPWFGPGPLGIIWLRIRRKAGPGQKGIGMSTFNWIGRHYSIIGERPAKSTELWWQSLRRRLGKIGERVASDGALKSKPQTVWAFPAALAQLKRGAARADQPFS